MYVQVVTFQLQGLDAAQYRAAAEGWAPLFAAVPGLTSKLWLADPTTNTYGGVYVWDSRAALERYLDGPLFRALSTNPFFINVRAQTFDSLDAPNTLTAGPLVATVYRPE